MGNQQSGELRRPQDEGNILRRNLGIRNYGVNYFGVRLSKHPNIEVLLPEV
jgi:hypothetical protein